MRHNLAIAGAVTIAVALMSAPALAQEGEHVDEGPNGTLIVTGLVTFGVSYGAAVVVAAQSSQSSDHHLYVPIVGPWIDLGNRPGCGTGNVACDTETTNKVLIGVDGVFQALGAVSTVVGFLDPVPRRKVVAKKDAGLELHLTPARMGAGGYGVTAFGSF